MSILFVIILSFIVLIHSIDTKVTNNDEIEYKIARYDTILSAEHGLSLKMSVDDSKDLISLEMVGPCDLYYSVGYGTGRMLAHEIGGYSIVITGDNDDGWFEQILGQYKAGYTVPKIFNMISNVCDDTGFRRLIVERKISINSDLKDTSDTVGEGYYHFNTKTPFIDIMFVL